MTDSNKVDRIVEKIRSVWMTQPNLRLGQLLETAKSRVTSPNYDLYYFDDSALEKALDEMTPDHLRGKRPLFVEDEERAKHRTIFDALLNEHGLKVAQYNPLESMLYLTTSVENSERYKNDGLAHVVFNALSRVDRELLFPGLLNFQVIAQPQ